jgi:hypothetical protein
MWKIFVFRVNAYSIEKGTCFFRDKTSPVKAFAAFPAD